MIAIMFGGRVGQSQKNHEQWADALSGKVVAIAKHLFNKNVKFHQAGLFFIVGCSFVVSPFSMFLIYGLYGLIFFLSFLRFHFGGSGWGREEIFVVIFLGEYVG